MTSRKSASNTMIMSVKGKIKDIAGKVKEEADVLKGEKGKDRTYTSSRKFPDEEMARREFTRSKARLFDINAWSDIPGLANASFTLHTSTGVPSDAKAPKVDDLIKIDLPGPVPFYWVQVIDVVEEMDMAEFRVKPTNDPAKSGQSERTDHFFKSKARSTFRVERQGNEIRGMEIGTDETINNDKEEAGDKAVINTMVSETAWAFFQENQWKNLTDYLVGT